jgi:hypothetical protein
LLKTTGQYHMIVLPPIYNLQGFLYYFHLY